MAERGAFAQHNLWVTAYHPDERKAAGDYPNQHAGGDGLPRFVAQDRELEGRDVVVWATFGTTHIARPEDWPVMPVEYVGMLLQPCGFFDRNPAIEPAAGARPSLLTGTLRVRARSGRACRAPDDLDSRRVQRIPGGRPGRRRPHAPVVERRRSWRATPTGSSTGSR